MPHKSISHGSPPSSLPISPSQHSLPSVPNDPSPSPTPLARKDSIKSYLASGHGITFPLTHRLRHALSSTPLIERIPQVCFIPAPSSSSSTLLSSSSAESKTTLADAPLRRLWHDIATFFRSLEYLPYALLPLRAARGRNGEGDEDDWKGDHESWRSKRDDVLVGAASVVQVLALPLIPIAWAVLPGLVFAAVLVLGGAANWLLLRTVQGRISVASTPDTARSGSVASLKEGEKWFFVNGIMTGYVGLQSAVDHISQVFGRPVVGIHNRTEGFVGDIIECLIQRCFTYNTEDVRVAYDRIRACLIDQDVKKIVLLAHSQGGITASMVLDKLLTELPRDCLGKLEIYTFGSAASHFSNPLLSLSKHQSDWPQLSSHQHRSATLDDLSKSVARNQLLPTNSGADSSSRHQPNSYPGISTNNGLPTSSKSLHNIPDWPFSTTTPNTSWHSSIHIDASNAHSTPPPKRTIQHIEHYANELDPIPRWGVLHSVADLASTHYAGSVFIRLGASGHLFSKHYLAALFPADEDERGLFWDREVWTEERGVEECVQELREEIVEDVHWGDGTRVGSGKLENVGKKRVRRGLGGLAFVETGGKKVRELGRLWGYVDGGSPED